MPEGKEPAQPADNEPPAQRHHSLLDAVYRATSPLEQREAFLRWQEFAREILPTLGHKELTDALLTVFSLFYSHHDIDLISSLARLISAKIEAFSLVELQFIQATLITAHEQEISPWVADDLLNQIGQHFYTLRFAAVLDPHYLQEYTPYIFALPPPLPLPVEVPPAFVLQKAAAGTAPLPLPVEDPPGFFVDTGDVGAADLVEEQPAPSSPNKRRQDLPIPIFREL